MVYWFIGLFLSISMSLYKHWPISHATSTGLSKQSRPQTNMLPKICYSCRSAAEGRGLGWPVGRSFQNSKEHVIRMFVGTVVLANPHPHMTRACPFFFFMTHPSMHWVVLVHWIRNHKANNRSRRPVWRLVVQDDNLSLNKETKINGVRPLEWRRIWGWTWIHFGWLMLCWFLFCCSINLYIIISIFQFCLWPNLVGVLICVNEITSHMR